MAKQQSSGTACDPARCFVREIRTRLDRITAVSGLNAVTRLLADRAMSRAELLDGCQEQGALGPLAGKPFLAKDLFDVAGLATTAGARVKAGDAPAPRDAALITHLEQAGAILVGTTNMDAFAYGFSTENAWTGRTLNPHDLAHMAGGSSGGSAAAVAVLSTHLGNGLASPLERHPNLLWAQLADDRLTATFIADGHHLPADTLRAMIRAKGVERAILVSDAVALAGLPAGDYDTPIGGQVTLTDDGRLGLSGTPFLAGAARPLIDCIAWVVRDAGVSLADAVRMATANPAQFVGGGGELAVGARADMMRFRFQPGDSKLVIDNVWLGGRSTASAE